MTGIIIANSHIPIACYPESLTAVRQVGSLHQINQVVRPFRESEDTTLIDFVFDPMDIRIALLVSDQLKRRIVSVSNRYASVHLQLVSRIIGSNSHVAVLAHDQFWVL